MKLFLLSSQDLQNISRNSFCAKEKKIIKHIIFEYLNFILTILILYFLFSYFIRHTIYIPVENILLPSFLCINQIENKIYHVILDIEGKAIGGYI